jgi:two-component system alkaline phosphatase synthesis response regulator PhoP
MPSTILIVDDEAFIRLLIEQTLEDFEELGVQIFSTDNGEDALKIIQTEKPALIFLDVMMPKMNGFDVCQIVKHDLKMEAVYIVMLTAKGQELDRLRGEQAGADIYMTKPFDPDELIALANRVLVP